ncbi:M23 family metallopeptidase [Paracraurococcus lichenis]|uniref:M23 family metallopeptidase n=1 Tax=Paracraurococcus lichenis TaxID=3064888 RepID=A0ABT9E1Z6_9PROT|nr:M23 family metallopeptidase [Paracraurococcus sp. LOR1-02]MDO9710186.1 M23 family metallopeptidase [Paracraurococcus sp. LOR1-02]
MPRRSLLALAGLAALPAHANGYEQGALVVGRVAPGTRLALDGRPLRVGPGGEYAFGLGRDHGPEAVLTVTPPGGTPRQERLAVAKRQWPVQSITGLPPAQVTPDPEALRRIAAERERLAAVRGTDSALTHFAEGFVLPAHGRVSGVFGSQRILNGEPRQPHFGFDIAAPTGTPIQAACGGTVTLAAEFFFFGRLIVLDHGHGVNTLYAHCSAVEVTEGQKVAAGQRIGAIGATGRVTGPHLHFGLSWLQTWLDAQPVLPPVTG